jgi:hypothetical protein
MADYPSLAPLVRKYVGKVGTITVERGQLAIPVRIVDVRHAYGRAEFRCEPVAGTGVCWKAVDSVEVKGEG